MTSLKGAGIYINLLCQKGRLPSGTDNPEKGQWLKGADLETMLEDFNEYHGPAGHALSVSWDTMYMPNKDAERKKANDPYQRRYGNKTWPEHISILQKLYLRDRPPGDPTASMRKPSETGVTTNVGTRLPSTRTIPALKRPNVR